MDCFCCPQKEEKKENQLNQSIRDSLIEKGDVQAINSKNNINEEPFIETKAELFRNPLLKKMEEPLSNYLPQLNGSPPQFQSKSIIKSTIKSSQKAIAEDVAQKLKKKSDIWDIQNSSQSVEIVYTNMQKQSQIVLSYRTYPKSANSQANLIHSTILNYLLSSKKQSKNQEEYELVLIASSKVYFESKSIVVAKHIKPIFANMKRIQMKKNFNFDEEAHEIITLGGYGCMRIDSFDKVIISLEAESDLSNIIEFCQKVTEGYTLEDFVKIVYILPPFLTYSDISKILSYKLRKSLLSQKLESIHRYISYEIDLIHNANIEPCMLLRSNYHNLKPEQISLNREVGTKIELAMGLLLIDVDENNFNVYRSLVQNFVCGSTLLEYVKYKNYLQRDKGEFINRLNELKLFSRSDLMEIESSTKIEEKVLSEGERSFSLRSKNRRKFSALFHEYKSTKTPVEQAEFEQSSWDQHLKGVQIHAQIQEQEQNDGDGRMNIMQMLDDSMVDRQEMDMILDIQGHD